LFIADIEREVRECDLKILDWLDKNGCLKEEEYILISRPELIKERIKVLRDFGVVKVNNNCVYPANLNTDISTLPLNSDVINTVSRSPMWKIIYYVVQYFRPKTEKEIQDIIHALTPCHTSVTTLSKSIKKMRLAGIIKKNAQWYPLINIHINIQEAVEEWHNYMEFHHKLGRVYGKWKGDRKWIEMRWKKNSKRSKKHTEQQ